jgi:hypothetical protein
MRKAVASLVAVAGLFSAAFANPFVKAPGPPEFDAKVGDRAFLRHSVEHRGEEAGGKVWAVTSKGSKFDYEWYARQELLYWANKGDNMKAKAEMENMKKDKKIVEISDGTRVQVLEVNHEANLGKTSGSFHRVRVIDGPLMGQSLYVKDHYVTQRESKVAPNPDAKAQEPDSRIKVGARVTIRHSPVRGEEGKGKAWAVKAKPDVNEAEDDEESDLHAYAEYDRAMIEYWGNYRPYKDAEKSGNEERMKLMKGRLDHATGAMEKLKKAKSVVEIPDGTEAEVLKADQNFDVHPFRSRNTHVVRILDGPLKGRILRIDGIYVTRPGAESEEGRSR